MMADSMDVGVLRLKLHALLAVADAHMEPAEVNGVLLAIVLVRVKGDIGSAGARRLMQRVVEDMRDG